MTKPRNPWAGDHHHTTIAVAPTNASHFLKLFHPPRPTADLDLGVIAVSAENSVRRCALESRMQARKEKKPATLDRANTSRRKSANDPGSPMVITRYKPPTRLSLGEHRHHPTSHAK